MSHPPADIAPQPGAPTAHGHHQSLWLWVMCLTGVDYFSTLGYQPSIAFDATGRLSPFATIVLVLVTLFGAVPVYRHVASQSPHGQGSIAMLERLVHGWWGKTIVLVLLGFAATDFVITKTLSAADAAEHLIHNPIWHSAPKFLQSQIVVTMALLVFLGAVFLRGYGEVIGVAVVVVGVYLSLNATLIAGGIVYLVNHPDAFREWMHHVTTGNWELEHRPLEGHGWGTIIVLSLLFFPKLALGLSGFETGVAVMPLVRGEGSTDDERMKGRIRNTRRMLLTAAIIMSVLLLGSSFITATLINPAELREGGHAANRALAYLAHGEGERPIAPFCGRLFGTIYDVSTIVILWFAGASAMAGLLSLKPQYLPRYGMAPEWARAVKPLVVLFTVVNLFVTWVFKADVLAQGSAYATGVLVLMSSACVATLIDYYRMRAGRWWQRLHPGYLLITALFFYTTAAIIIEKPAGIQIAGCFIIAIIASSIISRAMRSTELRFAGFRFVDEQSRFLWDSMKHLEFPVLVPHRPGARPLEEKEKSIRLEHHIPAETPIVFMEIHLGDASDFYQMPLVEVRPDVSRITLRITRCVSIAHVIAAVGLELSRTGRPPEIHFGWSNEAPIAANLGFLLFGEGNVPWMVRELILRAEPDPARQPRIIIG